MTRSSPLPNGDQEVEGAFSTFQDLVGISARFLGLRRHREAAAAAQIAAMYASYNHPGAFVSPRLERVLQAIAVAELPAAGAGVARTKVADPLSSPARVLHVLTAAKDVGGDSRFVWRWIQRDRERRHSVALTYQLDFAVPRSLSDVVSTAGGTVHVLDRGGAHAIQRAASLRQAATEADVVFLHVYPEDVVPVMAFADRAGLPPIVFVAQADHQFWMGLSACDLFVHLRESGRLLSRRRRGIDSAVMPSLPIPLDAVESSASPEPLSKAQARRQLGLPTDAVVLLSIARAIKYEPIGDTPGFAEVLSEVVGRHDNAIMLVVGPDEVGQWKTGSARTNGRIRAMGQRSDTAAFFAASDIYLDSFPFSSNTSLLEAGSCGLPLLSYFPYSEASSVLGAGAPGLDDCLTTATDLVVDYPQKVSALIENAGLRQEIGLRTSRQIARLHVQEGWNEALESVYRSVRDRPKWTPVTADDQARCEELDLLLNRYYSRHVPLGWIVGWYARHLPYLVRVRLLIGLMKQDRSFTFSMFLPDPIARALGGRLRGWRRLPVLGRWLTMRGKEATG